ncbi:hypothetical protein QFC24_006511 [Naganishia onofrii]|uniref:Uncharacterized protein n=1 Tax=Naganishia onofrii TaxID=1851511 RepID=A0ACC2X037_9TREE|nr:hypothetical protein QFC24_006511 [Naganishia onofrii]
MLRTLATTSARHNNTLRSSVAAVAGRRYASHGPSYNAPSGYIFGEKVSTLLAFPLVTGVRSLSDEGVKRLEAGVGADGAGGCYIQRKDC